MQKVKTPIAKLLVFALTLALFAGIGPAAINASAADFLANAVPTQAYLSVYGYDVVETDEGTFFFTYANKVDDVYYVWGYAAYAGSYTSAEDGWYNGYFSSKDCKTWTVFGTEVPEEFYDKAVTTQIQIPLTYKIVAGGKNVLRGGYIGVITKKDLSDNIPAFPVASSEPVTYEVGKGETIEFIAKKFGVTADALKAANKAYFDDLAARCKAYGLSVSLEAFVVLTIPIKNMSSVLYTVQPGDKLYYITYNYYKTMSDAKMNEVRAANKDYFAETKGVLKAGTQIVLPGNGIREPISLTHISNSAGIYRVQTGDTLSSIALKYYGASGYYYKLVEANKAYIDIVNGVHMIYSGQLLVIPN